MFGIPLNKEVSKTNIVCKNAYVIVNYGIPIERKQFLISGICNILGYEPDMEELVELAKQEIPVNKVKVKSHGQIVLEQLDSVEKLQEFTERWRKYFVDNMKPKFMPENWDIYRKI